MNTEQLIIAKELIEILAKHPCAPVGSVSENPEVSAVKRIIEAARINYVLPSFCAEMNTRAGKCIDCIIEHKPPKICRQKLDTSFVDDLDIEWDTL